MVTTAYMSYKTAHKRQEDWLLSNMLITQGLLRTVLLDATKTILAPLLNEMMNKLAPLRDVHLAKTLLRSLNPQRAACSLVLIRLGYPPSFPLLSHTTCHYLRISSGLTRPPAAQSPYVSVSQQQPPRHTTQRWQLQTPVRVAYTLMTSATG